MTILKTFSNLCFFSLIETPENTDNKPEDAQNKVKDVTDTLDKDESVLKKFSYHQDSMKRYKKQVSKTSDILVPKELNENKNCGQ